MALILPVYSIPYTGKVSQPSNAPGAFVVTWTFTAAAAESDTVQGIYAPDYSEKTVDVEISGTTPSVSIQGGNDLLLTTPKTLSDAVGDPLTFTSNGLKFIQQNSAYIKPSVPTGTGVTCVIRLLMTTVARRQ